MIFEKKCIIFRIEFNIFNTFNLTLAINFIR